MSRRQTGFDHEVVVVAEGRSDDLRSIVIGMIQVEVV